MPLLKGSNSTIVFPTTSHFEEPLIAFFTSVELTAKYPAQGILI
jgi:hypothetical protein